MSRLNLKEISKEVGIRWLNQRPLVIPAGAIPIKIQILNRKLTVLSPVNSLNKLRKPLRFDVQEDFCMANNFDDCCGLITTEGITYLWQTAIH